MAQSWDGKLIKSKAQESSNLFVSTPPTCVLFFLFFFFLLIFFFLKKKKEEKKDIKKGYMVAHFIEDRTYYYDSVSVSLQYK